MDVATLCLLASVLLAAPVQAQTELSADDMRARELFERANIKLRSGELPEARDLLRASLALAPRQSTAFNLGVALRGTGETLEAVALFTAIQSGEYGELPEDRALEVRRLLEATRAETATLVLTVRGAARARARVGTHELGVVDAASPRRFVVDAGQHVVSARAPEHTLAERHVTVERGGHAEVALTLIPIRTEERSSVFASPWFWTLSSIGVVAAGVGIALGILLQPTTDLRDPIFGSVEVLTAP